MKEVTKEEKERIKEELKPKIEMLCRAWNEGRMRVDDYIDMLIAIRGIEAKYKIRLLKLD